MEELPTLYQQTITKSKYARWDYEKERRETWGESVDRLVDFYVDHCQERGTPMPPDTEIKLQQSILNLHVSPSMRAMMTAGPALWRDNVAAYNCAYLAMNRVKAFAETLYILCCGTGVGYSVERQLINKLPEIHEDFHKTDTTIVIADSKIGWATAFDELLRLLYAGKVPNIDYSKVREAGAPLKTFGGRASGPGPLKDLFEHTIYIFKSAAGRKLTSEEVHSIVCKIGDIVVVGGVRRSALICLTNLSDDRMRDAKSGQWYEHNGHYALANISVAYTEKPSMTQFFKEWHALVKSGSGERGIFNREAAKKAAERIGRDPDHIFGTNPCGEIILRDRQFCNLTEVTVRAGDSYETLAEKVELATILGMIQSTFTNFRFLSKKWKENCDEERLLGVSFTGIMDHHVLNGRSATGLDGAAEWFSALRGVAWDTARAWAETLDINVPAAICTGKPSGNNSQRLDTASGGHPRYAPFYIRRTRMNKNDPMAQFLYYQGVPCEDEIRHPDTTWVFSWPIAAPEEAVTRHDITAIEQLQHWLCISENWCDHNQSITVNVRDHEWMGVGDFVFNHFDQMCGLTFLPGEDHVYQQAPYEEATQVEYEELAAAMPTELDWNLLAELEKTDMTEGAKELACVSGSCEL